MFVCVCGGCTCVPAHSCYGKAECPQDSLFCFTLGPGRNEQDTSTDSLLKLCYQVRRDYKDIKYIVTIQATFKTMHEPPNLVDFSLLRLIQQGSSRQQLGEGRAMKPSEFYSCQADCPLCWIFYDIFLFMVSLCSLCQPGPQYIEQAGLKVMEISLPPCPGCWEQYHVPPQLTQAFLF